MIRDGGRLRPRTGERVRGLTGITAALAVGVCTLACSEDDIVLYRLASGGSAASFGGDTPFAGAPGAGANGGQPAIGGYDGAGGKPVFSGSGGRSVSGGGIPASSGGDGGRGSGGSGPDASAGRGGGAGAPSDAGPGAICSTGADCPIGWACSKSDCMSPSGVCEPRPILCDLKPLPVCGCDHVTYWNDCVRRQNGVTASTAGQCSVGALACNTAQDCGVPGASCAHVLPSPLPCGPLGPGTCWVPPIDCTGSPPTPLWVPCLGSNPPFGAQQCVDTCTAIRSGQPYIPAPLGTSCP